MMSSPITLVIPTYNRCSQLRRCLLSLKEFAGGFPVLVVDDGGTDGTRRMIRQEFPRVRYAGYEKNRGPAHARNMALEIVETPYVAFFDSDILLTPRWPDVATGNLAPDTVIAGRVDRPDGSLEWGPRRTMFWGGSIPCPEKYANVASSNNMIMPVRLARSLGGFSERLGIYFEDTYFCISARRAGYRVRYIDDVRVVHLHDSRPDSFRIKQLARNRTYCMVKDSKLPPVAAAIQGAVAIAETLYSLLKKERTVAFSPLYGFVRGLAYLDKRRPH